MMKDKKTWEPTAKTQELSKFLYRAPDPRYVVVSTIILSLITGLLIQLGAEGLTYGVLYILLPALLSAWVSTFLVDVFGGKFYFRRSILTSFIGVFIIFFMLICGKIIEPIIVVHWRFVVIYSYSIVLSMRYLVLRTTCLNYHRYSFIVSAAQTFFIFIIHIALSFNDLGYLEENNFMSLQESSFGILSSLVLFLTSVFFVEIVNAPLKTDVGLNGTDLMGFFLSYMTEGTKEIETLFLPLQEEYSIPISIMAVKRKDKKQEKPFHALIISPSIHPGPVGTVGGGDLPTKLAVPLSDLADHILVPHGAATNDNNPATTEECDKIVQAVRELAVTLKEDDFVDIASTIESKTGNHTMHLMRFGEKGVVLSEPYPTISDDLDLSMFMQIFWITKHLGLKDIMVIDAHNNGRRGGTPVHLGDSISMEISDLVRGLAGKEAHLKPFTMGFGSARAKGSINGIGPKGVESIIIKNDDGTTGLILFDGNNMVPELRVQLIEEAEKHLDRVVIMTADNHVVNATFGGYNPVGMNCTFESLSPVMRESIDHALDDIGETKVAIKSGMIEKINILGFGNTTRLVATINSTVAVIKRAAAVCIFLAVTSTALVYYIV